MAQRALDDLDRALAEADRLLSAPDDDLDAMLAEADALLAAPAPRPVSPQAPRRPPPAAPAAPVSPARVAGARPTPAPRAPGLLGVERGGRLTLPGGASPTDLAVIESSPASRSLERPDPFARRPQPLPPNDTLGAPDVSLPARVVGGAANLGQNILEAVPAAGKGLAAGTIGAAASTAGTLASGAFARDAEEARILSVPAATARREFAPSPTYGADVLDEPGVMLDPRFWGYMAGQLTGSVASLAGAGSGGRVVGQVAASKLAQRSPALAAKLAAIGGPGAATAGESLIEAVDAYQTVISDGKTPDAAAEAAARVFSANAALLGLTNHPLFEAGGRGFRQVLKRALTEGGQEAGQTMAANVATDRPTMEGVGTSALVGAIGGPVAGAILDGPADRAEAPVAPPAPAQPPAPPIPAPPSVADRIRAAVAASEAARKASSFEATPAAAGRPNADLDVVLAEADAVLSAEDSTPPSPPVAPPLPTEAPPENNAATDTAPPPVVAPPAPPPMTNQAATRPPQWKPRAVDMPPPQAQTEPDVAAPGLEPREGAAPPGRDARRRVEDRRQASQLGPRARAAHFHLVRAAVLADAQDLDPNVDPERIRRELDARIEFFEDQQNDARDGGADPRMLLREIAKRGGIYEADNGMGQAGELRRLREGEQFGRIGGIAGVLAVKPRKLVNVQKKIDGRIEIRQERRGGLPLDVMLQDLQADGRFPQLQSIEDLTDFLDDVRRNGITDDFDILPGTEALRALGVRAGERWWDNSWLPSDPGTAVADGTVAEDDLDAAVNEADVLLGEAVDDTFDPAEFGDAPTDAAPAADLDTVVAEADAVLEGEDESAPAEADTFSPHGWRVPSGKGIGNAALGEVVTVTDPRHRYSKASPIGAKVRVTVVGPDPKSRNRLEVQFEDGSRAFYNVSMPVERDTPVADTLDTGEQQNRLPGDVGAVRDEERAQPTETVPDQSLRLTAEEAPKPQGSLDAVFAEADRVLEAEAPNPFTPRLAKARAALERLSPTTARDAQMTESFPLGPGVGRGDNARRIDRSVKTAVEITKLTQQVRMLEAQERAFAEGRINRQGRPVTKKAAPRRAASGGDGALAPLPEDDDDTARDLRRRVMATPERAVRTEPWMRGAARDVRTQAIAQHRYGGTRRIVNAATQHEIRIDPKGVKSALSHGIGPQKVALVPVLGDLLRDATPIDRVTDNVGPGVVAVESYAARVRVDDEPFVARLVVRELQDGRRFYDHHLTRLSPVRAQGSPVQSGAGAAAASAAPSATRPLASPSKKLLDDALNVKSGVADDDVAPMRASRPPQRAGGLRSTGPTLPAPGTATRAETPDNAKPSAIIRDMAKLLEVPVDVGRLGGRYLGWYNKKTHQVRTRVANDLPVLMHEFGHVFERRLALPLDGTRWVGELARLGRVTSLPSYSEKKVREEGLAEFLRLWVLTPDTARAMAPAFFEAVEKRLDGMGSLGKEMRDLQRRGVTYVAADPEARVALRIDFDGSGVDDIETAIERWQRRWVDDLYWIDRATQAMAGGQPIDPLLNGHLQARIARGSVDRAADFLENGVRASDGQFIGPSFAAAIRPVKDDLARFATYLVAKRAVELHGRRIETGISQAEAEGVVRAIEESDDAARFIKARDGVYAFQSAMLDYARKGGLITAEQQAAIQKLNQYYVPFQRSREGADRRGGTSRKLADRLSPVKRIKGSGRDIINPLESIVGNAYALIDAVEKNRAAQALAALADQADERQKAGTGSGAWLRRIPDPQQVTGVKLGDALREASKRAGVAQMDQSGKDTLPPELEQALADLNIDPEQVLPIFQPVSKGSRGEQIVTVLRDGKRQFYEVEHPGLYEALTQLHAAAPDNDGIAKMAASLLRAGATLTVGFVARNPARDTLSAFLQSRHGFIPIYDTLRGLTKTILHDLGVRRDEEVALFYSQGITQATLVGMDRATLRRKVRSLADPKRHVASVVLNPVAFMQAISSYSEVATRVGEFSLALRQGGERRDVWGRLMQRQRQPVVTAQSLALSTLDARDVTTDFSRAGTQARELNATRAFFNARVQGYVRIAETLRTQPRTVAFNLGALSLAAVILKALNDDDRDYQELAEWEKLAYWHWRPAGADYFVRIPKPFEWAFVPNLSEAAVDFAKDRDPDAWKLVKAQVHDNARAFVLGLLPTLLLPSIEAGANYSFFRQRNIVSPWDLDLPLEQQAGDWTTATARTLTRLGVPLAPAKIDHLLFGHTAGLGRAAVTGIVDPALRSAGMAPPKASQPSPRWEDTPVVGAYLRSAAPKSDAESIVEFYENFHDMTGQERGHRRAVKAGDAGLAARILDGVRGQRWRGRETEMKAAKKRIDAIADEIEKVYADGTMTPKEKTTSLEGMRRALVYEARVGLGYESTDHVRRRTAR